MAFSAASALSGATMARSLPKQPIGVDNPYTGGVDEYTIGLAALNYFGITGDDSDTRFPCCCRHRRNDAAQVGDGKAFLQDKACREVERDSTGHCQVVDRAVNGQFANIPTWKEERTDDIGIGGEGQALTRSIQAEGCCIVHRIEQRI